MSFIFCRRIAIDLFRLEISAGIITSETSDKIFVFFQEVFLHIKYDQPGRFLSHISEASAIFLLIASRSAQG